MDIDVLKEELEDESYTGMTNEEAADALNVENIVRNRESMTGSEVRESIDVTEWTVLSDAKKGQVLTIGGYDYLDPFGKVADLLTAIFGPGATLTALAAARVETISRGVELVLGVVMPGHVEEARRG